MIEPADPNDPPKLVAAGKLDLAISINHNYIFKLIKVTSCKSWDLVSVPLNSSCLKMGLLENSDLKGKKLDFQLVDLKALLSGMLQKYNLNMSDVDLVNINFSLSPSLIAKKVDAVIGALEILSSIKWTL